MPFKASLAEIIAFRAAYICSSPECNALTVGPTTKNPSLKNKLGEAAHIYGEKPGAARHSATPPISVDGIENGLWLCASCHTLIDKNLGADYSVSELLEWKKEHEETISILLRTHKSPFPLIYRQSTNRKAAQDAVDLISTRGIYFVDCIIENQDHVMISVDEIRKEIIKITKHIDSDAKIKKTLTSITHAHREFMNELSINRKLFDQHLDILRNKVGRQLKILRDDIGCDVSGPITSCIQ